MLRYTACLVITTKVLHLKLSNRTLPDLNTCLDIIRNTKMFQILTKHLCLSNNSVVLICHQETQRIKKIWANVVSGFQTWMMLLLYLLYSLLVDSQEITSPFTKSVSRQPYTLPRLVTQIQLLPRQFVAVRSNVRPYTDTKLLKMVSSLQIVTTTDSSTD